MNRIFPSIRRFAVVLLILGGAAYSSPSLAEQNRAAEAKAPEMAAAPVKDRESWDIIVLSGKRVGYIQTTVRRRKESGREVVRSTSVWRLTLRRGTDLSEQVITTSAVETLQGELLRFECEMPGAVRTTGRVRGEKLDLEILAPGGKEPTRASISWSSDFLGPFAAEQSLSRRPMQPGQQRTFKMLVTGFNQVADVKMTAKDFESVKLPDGDRKLLRIETVTRLPDGQKIKSTGWCDRSGDVLKNYSEAMDVETFRVTKAEALKPNEAAQLDLLTGTMVKVSRPLKDPHRTKKIRYRVRSERGNPAEVFVNGPTQGVKSIDPHTAEITVYAIRPGQAGGNPDARAEKPTDDDLRPNNFIQSDDPLIVADARKVVGDEKDPWRVAVALERFVNREVSRSYRQAFATAAEVAKSREGDCSEHAVFLAALARARGIPARIAIGLVYMDDRQAFGYHAWTEVYVQGRWIPIDGTLALGGIGAAHLKIADSNLKASSLYNALLPVVQLIGQLRIEIVDAP